MPTSPRTAHKQALFGPHSVFLFKLLPTFKNQISQQNPNFLLLLKAQTVGNAGVSWAGGNGGPGLGLPSSPQPSPDPLPSPEALEFAPPELVLCLHHVHVEMGLQSGQRRSRDTQQASGRGGSGTQVPRFPVVSEHWRDAEDRNWLWPQSSCLHSPYWRDKAIAGHVTYFSEPQFLHL